MLFLTDFQPAVPGGKITLSVVDDGSGSEAAISPSKEAPGGQLELSSVLMSKAEPILIGKDILASIEKAPATSRWVEDPAIHRNIYQ